MDAFSMSVVFLPKLKQELLIIKALNKQYLVQLHSWDMLCEFS